MTKLKTNISWSKIQSWLDKNAIFFIILLATPVGWWLLFLIVFGFEAMRMMLGYDGRNP